MATKTFENLNKEKKDQIFNSLLNEFSEYRLSEAQVARIIKNCGIARGSFYKYFNDINDSYDYVLDVVLHEVHFDVFERIKKEKNNTLNAFYESTIDFINKIDNSKYRNFYKLYVEYNQYSLKQSNYNYHKLSKDNLILLVDGQKISDFNKIISVYKFVTMAAHATIKSILMNEDKNQELSDFKLYLNVIKKGLID
ncbi:TetR/AcrR family transcriptional regulator [Apilactobacillus micheneri]|uniref:TetR/AcrR family transcriptional regulator n=1 Tax=Apilactobacillus micheneri TaxID=1899430 RepID=A0A9Q8MU86_9LACO|nr:TetR/AcrR family transcriptional regulator [Apilactobacillus micheneri]TPR39952.1 TetR/AcrR family transcriptional regulator [Apilactobacillus micheneri]TPR41765.1 TetR/AcrR family transcriptional regulator [Apilactobacillus micheneri]TPR44154.1 TetR/AcrR family transcriptional regulator [Apilactobacillus micheneri]TPR45778.1 TetR/AcrR family transcriptional regulator [Apilactobacillus micheneri]TPR51541.1 TetR/AcrR family transcriptional regulator [Apilactobacillus micheneri]